MTIEQYQELIEKAEKPCGIIRKITSIESVIKNLECSEENCNNPDAFRVIENSIYMLERDRVGCKKEALGLMFYILTDFAKAKLRQLEKELEAL